ncbi:MAG: DUF192 domain-containing protein [Vicinamibacterales bacterium]
MTPRALAGEPEGGTLVAARDAATGRLLADRVALAMTRAARRKGLLGKDGLARGEALWIAPCRGVHTIGMRFAIDVVALDLDGRVIDCVEEMAPWRLRLPRSGTAGVLELAAGTLAAVGTRIGHVVTFERTRHEAPGTHQAQGTRH